MDSLMDRQKNGVSELVNRGNSGSREIRLYSFFYVYIYKTEGKSRNICSYKIS